MASLPPAILADMRRWMSPEDVHMGDIVRLLEDHDRLIHKARAVLHWADRVRIGSTELDALRREVDAKGTPAASGRNIEAERDERSAPQRRGR